MKDFNKILYGELHSTF